MRGCPRRGAPLTRHIRQRWLRLNHPAMLLAAFLLALQTLVVQTHVDLASAVVTSSAASRAADAAKPPTPVHVALPTCELCQDLALFGHYVPPAPTVFTPTPHAALHAAPSANVGLAPRQASHLWRSRAPPSSLHA